MKEQNEWKKFNPIMEDRKVDSMQDAIDFVGKLIQFSAFLREVEAAKIDNELRRFFDDGFIGPIASTPRRIVQSLQMIWQYNSKELFESLVQSPSVNSILLLLLTNEFYFPIDKSMPNDYMPIEIDYLDTNHKIGIVDRRKFAREIEVESVLIDAEIIKSHKKSYHLDTEFSVYEIEYAYTWDNRTYTNAAILKLNTSHLAWANRGRLLNFPRVDFNENDLDAKLSEGTKIEIYVATNNGQIRNPVYDDLIYEVAKM